MKIASTRLMLTEGKVEDVEELEDEVDLEKEEELVRKKGKMIITKLPKPSTIVFTRRSEKKAGKECNDAIFNRPPLTF